MATIRRFNRSNAINRIATGLAARDVISFARSFNRSNAINRIATGLRKVSVARQLLFQSLKRDKSDCHYVGGLEGNFDNFVSIAQTR